MNPTNPTNSKIRAFVAIELPDRVRSDIARLQRDMASAGLNLRWVKPSNMHLTLKFLGDVDREKRTAVCDSVARVAGRHPQFDLQPRGVGCFPGVKNPRVLWTGVAGAVGVLEALQAELENALIPLGFKAEKRPFRGHLTIGRVKARLNPRRLAETLQSHQGFHSNVFAATALTLFQSRLHPAGPEYAKLCVSPLVRPA